MLLGGLLVASLGIGHQATRAVTQTGGIAVLGEDFIAWLNGETGQTEASTPVSACGELAPDAARPPELTMLAEDLIAVTDPANGQVCLFDDDDLSLRGKVKPAPEARSERADITVVVARDHAYLIDVTNDKVARITRSGQSTTPITVPGVTDDVVPDAEAGVWVRTENGQVTRVVEDTPTPAPVSRNVISLTVGDGRPIAVTASGELLDLAAGRPVSTTRVPYHRDVLTGSPRGAGRQILLVDQRAARGPQLIVIDPREHGEKTVRTRIPVGSDARLGRPVQVGDRVYVPNYTSHSLHVFDIGTGKWLGKPISVPFDPDHPDSTFSLDVREGRLWVNDRLADKSLVIKPDGETVQIDKGEGDGPRTSADPDREPDPGGDDPSPEPDTSTPSTGTLAEPGEETDAPGSDPRPTGEPVPAPSLTPGTPPAPDTEGDRRAVPSVRGMRIGVACQQIESAGFTCVGQPTGSADSLAKIGVVTAQDPAGGATGASGTPVQLSYPDSALLRDHAGQNGEQACAEIRQQSGLQVECQLQPGPPGPPAQAGTVSGQEPAAGQPVRLRPGVTPTVTLTIYGRPSVPNVVGLDPGTACAQIQAAGYGCDARPDALGRHAVVQSQDSPAGTTAAPGALIVLHYAPVEPVRLQLLKARGAEVYVLRVEGDSNQPTESWHFEYDVVETLGYAYPADAPPQVGAERVVNGFLCDKDVDTCGYKVNHAYSRISQEEGFGREGWVFTRPVARLVSLLPDQTCAPGQVALYRTRYPGPRPNTHIYKVERTAGGTYSELLGCAWNP